jgi:ComF family protein
LDGIYAVAAYQEPLRTAIHEFKYGGVRVLDQPLGELLYTYWQCHGPTADIIVPVPLHAKRLRQRGYNQSDLLAQHLAIKTHIPLRSSLLDRIRYTSPQVELSPEQRHANVKGAFACTADLAGSSILLIDDVCTTGATLRACGQALRAAGAERLYGLVLATPARV